MPAALVITLGIMGAMGALFQGEGHLAAFGLFPVARPNPYNIGNCFQYKNCLGESIGNMWFWDPSFCKPAGGKSWKNEEGKCFNFPDGQQPLNPRDFVKGTPCPSQGARPG
jgi:hypothetical protein